MFLKISPEGLIQNLPVNSFFSGLSLGQLGAGACAMWTVGPLTHDTRHPKIEIHNIKLLIHYTVIRILDLGEIG